MPSSDLLASALHTDGAVSEEAALRWYESRSHAFRYSVERVAVDRIDGWARDPNTGDLTHGSGKFFRVAGLDVWSSVGPQRHWTQPIIEQPEIGILGFIARRIHGVLHLLVQAKMEPGNINLVQISPTVQATRSNYTQVHGGRRPPFVEYFLGERPARVLYDQLQSEQGSCYLRKRNRNAIVEVFDDFPVAQLDDFLWLTIGQLQRLARFPNVVHLDCRSILGSLSYGHHNIATTTAGLRDPNFFESRVLASVQSGDERAEHTLSEILGWMTRHKCATETRTRRIPLKDVTGWEMRDGVIRHESGCFFSVVGVSVRAENREVANWSQPLIQLHEGGILALVAQVRREVLHFLIQLHAEPGCMDIVELAPTVQCTPDNYLRGLGVELPPFVELAQTASPDRIRFDSLLSEEGGRYYHSVQRHRVVELDPGEDVEVPPGYIWMTMAQIQECARFSNLLNIELRSMLACVAIAGQ